MPPVDLVIFDCDGVLVDSEVLVIEIERVMLAEIGIVLSVDEINRRFTGRSDATMHAELTAEYGIDLGDDFAARRSGLVRAAFERDLRPVAGMPEVLAALTLPRCVASSSAPDRIAHSLTVTGLIERFRRSDSDSFSDRLGDRIFSASMVARGKPAPDLFLYAAARCGVAPDRCVVIEDSPFGIEGAVAAGMRAVGFTAAGHNPPDAAERLVAAGASIVVNEAAALPDCWT